MNTERTLKDWVYAAIFYGAIIGGILGLLAARADAQTVTTGPVTTAMSFEVGAPSNVTTQSQAETFEIRIKDGATPLTALVGFRCAMQQVNPFVQGGPPVLTCSANLTASNVDALNIVGTHNLTATFFRADVGEGPLQQSPFVLLSPVGAVTGVRIFR